MSYYFAFTWEQGGPCVIQIGIAKEETLRQ